VEHGVNSVLKTARVVMAAPICTALFGMAFLVRCEHSPSLPGGWPSCWMIGGSIAGVPFMKKMAEKAGFTEGYNTYNPLLRKPREEEEPSA